MGRSVTRGIETRFSSIYMFVALVTVGGVGRWGMSLSLIRFSLCWKSTPGRMT